MSPLVIGSAWLEPAARCLVCGDEVAVGEGLVAQYGDATYRFKCEQCLATFVEDPDRYLADHSSSCCPQRAGASPPSEWLS